MAQVRINTLSSNGRALSNATVTVYLETDAIAIGSESGFDNETPIAVFSDKNLSSLGNNPMLTNAVGEVVFYVRSYTMMAVKIVSLSAGVVWKRNFEAFGTDPLGS